MSFSSGQNGKYRPIVSAAWKAECAESGKDPKDKPAYESWYSAELKKSIGLTSTIPADKGFDFDLAIAHFESLAGESWYWQSQLRESIFNRIKKVSKSPWATMDYCRGIAKQSLQLDYLPQLDTLKKDDFIVIIRALKKDASRSR